MITLQEYYMGRDATYASDLSDEIRGNAMITVVRVNLLLDACKMDRRVVSGWRPQGVNDKTMGAAKKSYHLIGAACDLEDRDRLLAKWCLENLAVLEDIGLWLESPTKTSGWVHVQIYPPKSGKRVFLP